MTITIPSGRTLPLQSKAGGGFESSGVPGDAAQGLIFQENFDNQLDWDSGRIDTAALGSPDNIQVASEVGPDEFPDNWYSASPSPIWAPSEGYPSGHESIEILGVNTDKSRGGTGKSLVCWRDSGDHSSFASDSQLTYYIPGGKDQLFVRFYLKFDPNWTPKTGLTKLFRFVSWDGGDRGTIYSAFPDGSQSAIWIWDYQQSENLGARNNLAFRADPQETNYTVTTPPPINMPRTFSNGSMSLNFEGNIRDLDGDGTEENPVTLTSLVTGNPIGSEGIVDHADLWGDVWHKIEFYVKMNSAPGAMDGIAKQWIDDQLVFSNTEFPWMGTNSPGGIKWNMVSFGGNSDFHVYPDADQRQEWRAYDDIEIYDELPGDML